MFSLLCLSFHLVHQHCVLKFLIGSQSLSGIVVFYMQTILFCGLLVSVLFVITLLLNLFGSVFLINGPDCDRLIESTKNMTIFIVMQYIQ